MRAKIRGSTEAAAKSTSLLPMHVLTQLNLMLLVFGCFL